MDTNKCWCQKLTLNPPKFIGVKQQNMQTPQIHHIDIFYFVCYYNFVVQNMVNIIFGLLFVKPNTSAG